ncbi:MAG: PorT family protein [Bacteroidales bacterium]|nr:PorT family protein [Bacteroidales bacterium]
MNRFFLILFSLLISSQLFAQSISIGPKIGVVAGSPVPYEYIPQGAKGMPKAGRNVGLFTNIEFNDKYSITYEVNLTRKHTSFETPLDSIEYVDRVQHPTLPHIVFEIETWFTGKAFGEFDNFYVEQALMHNISITDRMKASVGVYSAWLQKSNTYATGIGRAGFNPDTVVQELDYASQMREWDYGLKAGIQVKATKNIDCDLKISYGFESVFNDSFTMFNYSMHNTFIELSIYYKFNVFKNYGRNNIADRNVSYPRIKV